jgi:uncharacterized membrane protein
MEPIVEFANPFTVCNNPNLPNEELFPLVNIFLTAFILVSYAIAVYHTVKQKNNKLILLISATIFGFILELLMIGVTHGYCYNPSWILMIGPVPSAIILSWGIIIYSVDQLLHKINLTLVPFALVNAFIAVLLDFILDPVAIRLSLWTWNIDLQNNRPIMTEDYYGIPWGNYWGWYWAIFSFVLVFRFLNQFFQSHPNVFPKLQSLAILLGSILIGMLVGFHLIMIFGIYEKVFSSSLAQFLLIILMLLVPFILILRMRFVDVHSNSKIPKLLFLAYYIVFTLLWLLIYSMIPTLALIIGFVGIIYWYSILWLPSKLIM